MTIEEILEGHPELEKEDITASLNYARLLVSGQTIRACKTINHPFRLVLSRANGVKKPRRSPTMPTFFALLAHKITSSILYHLLFCKPLNRQPNNATNTFEEKRARFFCILRHTLLTLKLLC
ncbi:MAG: DUF433 domain-containing protein [Lewinellaceae bacterium]|nr:DUF433 domain-containing protein [Lewinellaceae bacterium]